MNPTFRSTFPQQLSFWTFHCCLNALPSFCVAMFFTGLYSNAAGVMAMLSAIGIFILSYAVLTSFVSPLS